MTSFIVRRPEYEYTDPGCIMYLNDDGPLQKIDGYSDNEEEDEVKKKKEIKKRNRDKDVKTMKKSESSSHDVNMMGGRRGEGSGSSRRSTGDDHLGGGGPIDNDDSASTTSSSVPVDPATLIPVFLTPTEIEFVVAGDSPDARKVLSIYNPYDYAFSYRILCTSPEHYSLTSSNGVIGSKKVMEIAVRGLPTLEPFMQHRLKVEIRRIGQSELLGQRVVPLRAVAVATPQPDEEYRGDRRDGVFHSVNGARADNRTNIRARDQHEVPHPPPPAVSMSVICIISMLCLIALCLPIVRETVDTSQSLLPRVLHITETQRVVAAFILGVCSVLILQPANLR